MDAALTDLGAAFGDLHPRVWWFGIWGLCKNLALGSVRRCEVKQKKAQTLYSSYQECVFLYLISGCRLSYAGSGTGIRHAALAVQVLRVRTIFGINFGLRDYYQGLFAVDAFIMVFLWPLADRQVAAYARSGTDSAYAATGIITTRCPVLT
eukprot:3531741-Rhodomonas_salina.4